MHLLDDRRALSMLKRGRELLQRSLGDGVIHVYRLSLDGAGAADLLLQHQAAVQQGLGSRWAAWDVDVDWHHAITAAHHRVRVMIVAAAICAGAHRDDVPWLRHLVVDLAERRR